MTDTSADGDTEDETVEQPSDGTDRFEVGDRFEYEPTNDDDPYWGRPESDIPTETHEVVEVEDGGQLTTERLDDDSRQKHSWPPIDPSENNRIRSVDTDTDHE